MISATVCIDDLLMMFVYVVVLAVLFGCEPAAADEPHALVVMLLGLTAVYGGTVVMLVGLYCCLCWYCGECATVANIG
jgi:hypothetical protein